MNNRLRYFLNPIIFVVVVGGSMYVAYSRQQPIEKSPGSISGRLTSAQKPLSGIVVQLQGPPKPGRFEKSQVAQVVTDDGGNYNFQSIAPGTYDVVPATGAYTIADMTRDYQPGKTITVASGENISNINFELGLAATIRGQIKDAEGHPVASQAIELVIVEKDRSQSHFPARGAKAKPSDAQGNYSIDNVPPGRYLLSTERPGSGSMRGGPSTANRVAYPLTYYGGAHNPGSATVIEVAPGALLTGLDINLGAPLKTFQIGGRVIDEKTGSPVAKVSFDIEFRGMDGSGFSTGNGWKTDSTGQFSMPIVMPGHMIIRPLASAGENVFGDLVEFDIIDQDVTDLEVKMHRGSTLSGKVIIEGASGASDLEKMVKQKYYLLLMPSDPRTRGMNQSLIDADGNFQIVGMRPGRAKFLVRSFSGGQNEFSILKIRRDDQDLPEGIEIPSGDDVTGVQVVVKSTAAGRGIIRGEVKVEGGDLDGIQLSITCRRVGGPGDAIGVMLDTRNRFVIEKLQPGEYELMTGPMNVTISSEKGGKTMNRLPTVKQTVKVTDGAESEVILTTKLNPQ